MHRFSFLLFWIVAVAAFVSGEGQAVRPSVSNGACRRAVLEGEVQAGQSWQKTFGGGLELRLQPIASGWIVRVLPVRGFTGQHDYAELATPPYRSLTPLSLSTDFSFRAQDAAGWNPRRFRYAPDAAAAALLDRAYRELEAHPTQVSAELQGRQAAIVAQSPEASLKLLDVRLVAGAADQTSMAATVASHFNATAHTLQQPPPGPEPALGRLLWVRFRVELDLPAGFQVPPDVHLDRVPCPPSQQRRR